MADKEQKQIGEDTKALLDWAEKTLHAMLHGEKPAIDPRNPDQSWLLEQMSRMHKAGFLCEEPESYMMLPGEEGPEVLKYKGVTIREPLPKQLTTEAKYLREAAAKREISNIRLFGEDNTYRYQKDALDQLENADAFVLSKGGLVELYQLVVYMRAQLDQALPFENKPVIVQNSNGFWHPFISRFGEAFAAAGDRNYITDTRHDTIEVIDRFFDEDTRTKAPQWGADPDIRFLGMVTGNRKKNINYNKGFRSRGSDVETFWVQAKCRIQPTGADELKYSYIGNVIDKVEQMYTLVRDAYGPEAFRDELARIYAHRKDYDIGKSYFLIDDSGLEFEEGLTSGPEFENSSYRVNPYKKNGPGAELKNVLNAMHNQPFHGERSIRGFVKRVEAAHQRITWERKAAGNKDEVSKDVIDRSCAAIIPFKDFIDAIEDGLSFENVMEKIPVYFFQAATEHEINFDPRPDVAAVNTENYLVPKRDPDNRTQAENHHYIPQHSVTAQIIKAAARTMRFDRYEKESPGLARKFARESGEAWRVGTQQSIHSGINTHGLGHKVMRSLKGLYELMPGNGGRFDLTKPREHKMTCEDGSTKTVTCAVNNFHDFCRRVDGFLLTPDTRRISGQKFFWERMGIFIDLWVGAQINDKTITSKPRDIFDCPTWRPIIDMVQPFCGGLIPEMFHEVWNLIKPGDDIVKALNHSYSECERDEVPDYVFREGGEKCPEDLFNVTIYCSATYTHSPTKTWACDFAFDLAALGFAVTNGGGKGPDGLMVETSRGVLMVRNEFDSFLKKKGYPGAPRTHLSCIQCAETEQVEGLLPFADYWAVYPNIYLRMNDLHDPKTRHGEVMMPGGAGTIQELIKSVMRRKTESVLSRQSRPFSILNHERIFDPLINFIPKGDFKKYNLVPQDTADQALDLMLKARRNRGMEPVLPYTYEEYKVLKKEFMRERARLNPDNDISKYTLN